MPPKDDDDPKSTKEVVTKKQKQMLNREELDLSLIAEAFGGVVVEYIITGSGGKELERGGEDAEKIKRQQQQRKKKYQGPYKPRITGDVKPVITGDTPENIERARRQAEADIEKDQKSGRFTGSKPGGKEGKNLLNKLVGSPPTKVRGAAADPFLQFPKKPQKQYGLPKPPSSRVPYGNRTLSGTPLRSALPAARQTSTMTPDQVRQLLIPGYDSGSTKSSNLTKSLRTISSFPLLGGRTKAVITTATTAIDLAKAYRKIRDKKVEDRMQELELSRGLRPGRQPSETPTIKPFKPKKPFRLPSFPIPKPGPKTEPQTQPEADPGKKSKPKGIDMSSILRFFKIPGQGVGVNQKPQPKLQPQSQRPPVRTRSGTITGTKKQDKKKDRKPFSFPDQPGGVIGRRQNPQ